MALIALDQDSIDLMKLLKKHKKAKTRSDKEFLENRIKAVTDRINQKKEEAERYFARK